jgi:hypothetical protein
MHHFRGRLLDGDQARLDPANVYILFHHASAGGPDPGWHGYLLIDSEADLEPGESYTLTLTDGRSGSLRIDSLAPDDDGKLRAIFVGEGPLS